MKSMERESAHSVARHNAKLIEEGKYESGNGKAYCCL
jgi:hypothetical protein